MTWPPCLRTSCLRWVNSESKTGTLEIQRHQIRKRVIFRDGQVIACSSNDPPTRIGQYLLSRGSITPDQLQNALGEQEISGLNLGEILVESGAISKDERARFVQAKIEETVYGVFDWDDATFHFEPHVPPEGNTIKVALPVEQIIERGLERRMQIDEGRQDLARSRDRPPAQRSSAASRDIWQCAGLTGL